MKLTELQLKELIGKEFTIAIRKLERAIIQHAKKLTDKKLTSIKVIQSGIDPENNEIFVLAQGQWKGQGALNFKLSWPLKIGKFTIKFVEDVGNIPD